MATEVENMWQRLWRRMLLWGLLLVAGVTILGSAAGWLVAGGPGVSGALIGGLITAIFLGVSVLTMFLGRKLSLTGIAGALGVGFLFKAFIFMIVISRLARLQGIDGTVTFFTIVAAVLGTSLLDAALLQKARIPYVDPEAGRDGTRE